MPSDPHASAISPQRWSRVATRFLTALAVIAIASIGWSGLPPSASADTAFTFTGAGWGHGIGMSQWGARGMGASGSTPAQILAHYYSGTTVTTATSPEIRVLIATAPSFTFAPGATATFAPAGSSAGTVTATASGASIVLSGGISATVGGLIITTGGTPMRVTPPGNRYNRGALVLRPTGSGTIQAVLHISMQEYLYGLGEMPSSWPAAAMQSQAIAARTYAQKKVATVNGAGTYDIVGGLPDQSYIAFEKEGGAMGAQWIAAVDTTNTQVVTYGGGLIDAVYSASSGGYTENSEVVWVSAVPYLRGVADDADLTGSNPNASWVRTYSGAQLGAWFGLGQVSSVQVLGPLGVSGRVDKATIRLTGTAGTRDVTGTQFRSTVNAASPSAQLMSTKFVVNGGATPPPPPPSPANTPAWGEFSLARAEGSKILVLGHAYDPEGDPRVRITSTMGRDVAVREASSTRGDWGAAWTGSKGTRSICVTVIDNPTGAGVALGCRSVTVK